MAAAKINDTVQVHYTGKLADGSVFDSSEGREPLQFEIGSGQVIPGFEEAVAGMNPGEEKEVTITAEDAYGPFHNELVIEIPRGNFPEDAPLEKGQKFHATTSSGTPVTVSVIEVRDDVVVVDANHPLAGKALTFMLQLVDVVAAE